jgi:hypothetical protein
MPRDGTGVGENTSRQVRGSSPAVWRPDRLKIFDLCAGNRLMCDPLLVPRLCR